MHFTTLPFLLFLTVVLVLYRILPQKHRWYVLLAGSLFFYGYAGLSFLLYIGATVVSTYFFTMRMRQLRIARDESLPGCPDKESKRLLKASTKAACWKQLVGCLLINFGILAVLKYTDFVISNINVFLSGFGTQMGLLRFLLPLGISFYTFQTMGYAIDAYREKTDIETNPLKLALFVSFFPQIIQGPISRRNDLSHTLYAGNLSVRNISFGGQRVLWGFFKKLVIADRLLPAVLVLNTQTDNYQGLYVLCNMLIYAVTLYADFTGGIDIAIGTAEMFGVKVTENFNRPFYSTSIAEYWRRWHITMGTWFKDYLFYPISVCKPMLRLSKTSRTRLGEVVGRRVPVYLSILAVWFMTGLWHGATWNFIVWGLANGVVILISQELQPLYDRFNKRFAWTTAKPYRVFSILRTFWLMCFIRSFDCYAGVGNAFKMMASVFTRFNPTEFITRGVLDLGLPVSGYISAGLGLTVVFAVSFIQRNGTDAREWLTGKPWVMRCAVVASLFFMVLVFGAYGIGYDARQFIYNQF